MVLVDNLARIFKLANHVVTTRLSSSFFLKHTRMATVLETLH